MRGGGVCLPGSCTPESVVHVYRCRVDFEAVISVTRGYRDARCVKAKGYKIEVINGGPRLQLR